MNFIVFGRYFCAGRVHIIYKEWNADKLYKFGALNSTYNYIKPGRNSQ